MPAAHTVRLYRAQPSSTDESERCGRAAFALQHLSAMRLLITVTGDLDATNARALGRFVERHTGMSTQLVLDLSDVEFFGTAGFAALHYVSVHCARHDVDWLFIGGPTVRRLVAICDPRRRASACRRPDRRAGPPRSPRALPASRPVRRVGDHCWHCSTIYFSSSGPFSTTNLLFSRAADLQGAKRARRKQRPDRSREPRHLSVGVPEPNPIRNRT